MRINHDINYNTNNTEKLSQTLEKIAAIYCTNHTSEESAEPSISQNPKQEINELKLTARNTLEGVIIP